VSAALSVLAGLASLLRGKRQVPADHAAVADPAAVAGQAAVTDPAAAPALPADGPQPSRGRSSHRD
jgi:hypothetical protein